MSKLLIVESPNKAKTIRKYFPDMTVVATVGHIRDLPVNKIGVKSPDHKPEYETLAGKDKVIKQLRVEANKANEIWLATDLDREGEAIAGHVVNVLGKRHASKIKRITFEAVSKNSIQAAMKNPRHVDWNMFKAQEARRVIDRYVGYLVSPILSAKFRSIDKNVPFVTAGRVQSIALKIIAERHKERECFKAISHYGVQAHLEKANIAFSVQWQLPEGVKLMTDKTLALSVANRTKLLAVAGVYDKKVSKKPPKPLITSSFLNLMAGTLKLTAKKSMSVAQSLFEAGKITYHRTDSPAMGSEFTQNVRAFAKSKNYAIPDKARTYSAKSGAQEAHECLRVTDVSCETYQHDDPIVKSVYEIIHRITVQSQCADAVDIDTQYRFENETKDIFSAKSSREISSGWRKVGSNNKNETTGDQEKSEDDENKVQLIPELFEKESLEPKSVEMLEKKTKPPATYNERSLLAKLDKLKIGRPSTYAQIIERIVEQKYVARTGSNLVFQVTDLGLAVIELLDEKFSFMVYAYTADLEKLFDLIASKKIDYLRVVSTVYDALAEQIEALKLVEVKNMSIVNAAVRSIIRSTPKTKKT